MKIRIDGTNTVNKGAELMLYAILDKVNQFDSSTIIEYNMTYNDSYTDSAKIKTNLDFRILNKYKRMFSVLKLPGILRRLGLPYNFLLPYHVNHFQSKVDILLDASGFKFSDQLSINRTFYDIHSNYYRKLKNHGTFIVFLPQAFGPFQSNIGKMNAKMLVKYADIIFVRDAQSYQYFVESGCDTDKILIFPDFTSTISGTQKVKYQNLTGGIGIIPNKRMIDRGGLDKNHYYNYLTKVIDLIVKSGHKPYLLNHESMRDSVLCHEINTLLDNKLTIVDNVNALEVKGVISKSYMLISSRYHGVASALNSGVPCLATSWSHKYNELFKDFNQDNCLLDINDIEASLMKIREFMDPVKNNEIKQVLSACHEKVKCKNEEMWQLIWEKYKYHIQNQ